MKSEMVNKCLKFDVAWSQHCINEGEGSRGVNRWKICCELNTKTQLIIFNITDKRCGLRFDI